jgi:MFS transporter, DHA1 family, inner membrane transport protein
LYQVALRTPSADLPAPTRDKELVVTTAPTVDRRTPSLPRSGRHVTLAIIALAMGGFAIGTTEFVTMGLLPELARGVDVSIPAAGHVISAYALGVVVGAPLIAVFGARLPRRALLVVLMGAFAVGNAGSALAVGYEWLTVARFVSGLPHGAFFGVASLVAAALVAPHRKGRAVSLVMLGLPVANVIGVPAATWMGQHLGWRSAYWAVAVLGLVTVALVVALVPSDPGNPTATGRSELGAFRRPQVWLTLVVGAVGFGGMFSMYSYIAPTVTDVTDLSSSAVPLFLLAFGVGGVVGTVLGGHLADWSIFRSLIASSVAMGVSLAVFTVTAYHPLAAALTVFAVATVGSVLVVNLQMRLMQVAGDAQTLGAAMNHASLNAANALGAWLGGLVIAAGHGYTAPSWVGAGLSAGGLLVLAVSAWLHRRPAYSHSSRS